MITIQNLSIAYQKNQPIINQLNLQLIPQTIHGLVGLNGAGKTTLLNSIYGIRKADQGSILSNDTPLTKKDISYLVTENYFYPNITAREYLNLFPNKSFDLDQWNQLFNLPLDQVIDGFSTGMRKKTALLGILKQNKPIMILDEPFNGLDIETSRIIRSILLKLKAQGKTIIITSHIIETLTNLCDQIHYLAKGKIHYSTGKEGFKAFEKDIFQSIETKNNQIINKLFTP